MGERGNRALRFADFWLGIPLTSIGALYRFFNRPKTSDKIPQKICILCLGAIGDLLLASLLANGFKRLWPEAKIAVVASLANAAAAPLIADLDSWQAFSAQNPLSVLAYLRKNKFDLLVDTGQWCRLSALLSSFSQADVTIGFKTAGQYRACGYDCPVIHAGDRHELENFANLGKRANPKFCGRPALRFGARPAAREKILFLHFYPAPGKGRFLKEWPEENWAELIREALRRGFKVNLTGGEADRAPLRNFIKKYFPDESGVKSLAGVALLDLSRLLAKGAALVSVNTGVMHLAALMNLPVVALHGATNPARWGPIGANSISLLPDKGESAYLNLGFEYPRGARPAMNHISVKRVIDALERLGVW